MGDFDKKGAAGGAVSGGMQGAAVGTMIMPGYGTAIGAGVGALGGALAGGLGGGGGGYKPNPGSFEVNQYDKQFNDFTGMQLEGNGRRAPQAGFGNDYRKYQNSLLAGLKADFQGKGPGQKLVRMQAQQMADRAAQQQLAMARSARPGQSGMAATNAAFNAANAQSQVGGQAAMAGLQARLAAGQQLGQFSGQARGQDIQSSQFNADMRLRQMGLNDATQLEALRQRMALSGMLQQGTMGYEQIRAGQSNAALGQPQMWERLMGGGAQAAQTYAMFNQGNGSSGQGHYLDPNTGQPGKPAPMQPINTKDYGGYL